MINKVQLNLLSGIGIILCITNATLFVLNQNTKITELEHKINEAHKENTKIITDFNNFLDNMEDTLKNIEKHQESLKLSFDKLNKESSDTVSRGGHIREYHINKEILSKYKPLKMRATTYDLSVESCGKPKDHPNYGITYTGEQVIQGTTVAVDPKTIPLGSILYIEIQGEYNHLSGVYRAMDTGRLVKKDIIDIYVGEDAKSFCYNFGIQKVTVYILE